MRRSLQRNLRNCILSNDWLKLDCKSYLPVRNELTTIGFIVLRGTRIVIPSELREHVLTKVTKVIPES